MNLFQKITTIYPELTISDFTPPLGCICLTDDSDGKGPYISKWEYSKPQPTQEQLDALND
jgi:hypothetical protein